MPTLTGFILLTPGVMPCLQPQFLDLSLPRGKRARRSRKELSEVNLKLPKSKHLFRLDRGDVFNEGLNNLMQAPSKKGSQQARRIEEDFITSEDRLGMFDLKFVVPKLSRFNKASYEDLLKSDADKAREREMTE